MIRNRCLNTGEKVAVVAYYVNMARTSLILTPVIKTDPAANRVRISYTPWRP